jgi:small subunit ribosomal protein S17
MSAISTKNKEFTGTVVSDKMKDTIVVSVERFTKHPRYGKYIRSRRKFKVHDVGNTKKIGEKVVFIACRPISKDKRFRVI